MKARIEQQGEGAWRVSYNDDHHWACNAEDAVRLARALERAREEEW